MYPQSQMSAQKEYTHIERRKPKTTAKILQFHKSSISLVLCFLQLQGIQNSLAG